ncbi:hypothetical protein [Marispirochaeta aestuarii]|uniref:hypothetical protein n=1 Tax=Marispirochaeta aestuarii TaxID=1963862 RepID=UPI0029C7BC85|nr:hypothetical protein [Marispirochaeta aestuarii]
MDSLFAIVFSSLGTTIVLIVVAVFYWDRVEYFISSIMKVLSIVIHSLRKKSVQLNVQSRINLSIKRLKRFSTDLESEKISIDWIDKTQNRKAFLDDGITVLRLKKDDTNEQNFIHGTYLYVATCLLFKVKNHLNPSQKETMDLFVTSDLIRNEKNSAIDFFVENYLRPAVVDKPRKQKYLTNYKLIDEHGLFYPLLLNELNFLGKKVFTSVGKQQLNEEFDSIITFLVRASNRKLGDDFSDLEFYGKQTRLIIVIIGKRDKVDDPKRYVDFIESISKKNSIFSVYAVGDIKNKKVIDNVCNSISHSFKMINSGKSDATLNTRSGEKIRIEQYYTVLRRNEDEMVV